MSEPHRFRGVLIYSACVLGGLAVLVGLAWVTDLIYYAFTGHFPPDL